MADKFQKSLWKCKKILKNGILVAIKTNFHADTDTFSADGTPDNVKVQDMFQNI